MRSANQVQIPLLLAALLAIAPACDSPTSTRDTTPAPDRIDFSRLAVGQSSSYAGFTGEDYRTREDVSITYTGDVLIVEVVAETDTGFIFREHIVPGSPSLAGKDALHRADEVYEWVGRMVGGTLERVPLTGWFLQSHLLPNPPGDFPMGQIEGVESEIVGWVTSVPYCECYTEGHVLNHRQFGRRYDRLNLIVDDRPMQTDSPGETFLYSREAGFVRTSSASWWTQEGRGWALR